MIEAAVIFFTVLATYSFDMVTDKNSKNSK